MVGKHRRRRDGWRSRTGCAVIALTAPLILLAITVHEVRSLVG